MPVKKILKSSGLFALSLVLLTGCASILSKSDYPVNISSQPQGADISIVNRSGETVFTGKTPTSINLKAGAGYFKGEIYNVTFKKDGYTLQTAQIERGVDGWYIAGNFVFGGLLGWLIVDPATGAMWTLKNLHLDLNTPTSSLQREKIHIVTINDVPVNYRSKMVKIN